MKKRLLGVIAATTIAVAAGLTTACSNPASKVDPPVVAGAPTTNAEQNAMISKLASHLPNFCSQVRPLLALQAMPAALASGVVVSVHWLWTAQTSDEAPPWSTGPFVDPVSASGTASSGPFGSPALSCEPDEHAVNSATGRRNQRERFAMGDGP